MVDLDSGGPMSFFVVGMLALLAYVFISVVGAIGLYFVAGRLNKSRWGWCVLSLVPLVNVIFWIYAFFAILIGVLDRLNAIADRIVIGSSNARDAIAVR